MESLISIHNVSKSYGRTVALHNLNFSIPPGKIVGLVGPNGAGKTTLLRALTGLISYEGTINVLGWEPNEERKKLMERVGVIHDVPVLPPWMKVKQLIAFHEQMQPEFSREKCEQFLERTSVTEDRKVKNLSKGMKTQLHLALMLATKSEVLILDEPTHGLDILFRKQFYNTVLEDYFDQTKSIIVSTHQIEEVEHILSDVIFIKEGEVILYESIDNLNDQFIQVTTSAQDAGQVRKLNPLIESNIFGKKVFLLKDADRTAVEKYGEVTSPSLADMFVALMEGGQA